MQALSRLCFLGVLFVLPSFLAAGEAVSPEQIRKVVERSVPFLEKEGVAWMKGKNCVTCHQVPSMVWSLNEATRRKLPVNAEAVTQWNRWALENGLKKSVFFKLTDKSLESLREAGMPEAEIAKLKKLQGKLFVFEQEFRDEATKLIGSDTFGSHSDRVVKLAALPNQGGGGGGTNNQYTALLLSGATTAVPDSAEMRKAVITGLVKAQGKDGTWPAASQFIAQQRTAAETSEVVTSWTVLALTDAGLPELTDKAIAKARDWLKNAKPAVNTETLMLRALLASKEGDTSKQQELTNALLKLQHADGGWGWQVDRTASDPFSTGQVLYGLANLGKKPTDPAVQKAQQYLLQTQSEKGMWPVTNKDFSTSKKADRKDGDAVYSYWATGWAVIGLLQTMGE